MPQFGGSFVPALTSTEERLTALRKIPPASVQVTGFAVVIRATRQWLCGRTSVGMDCRADLPGSSNLAEGRDVRRIPLTCVGSDERPVAEEGGPAVAIFGRVTSAVLAQFRDALHGCGVDALRRPAGDRTRLVVDGLRRPRRPSPVDGAAATAGRAVARIRLDMARGTPTFRNFDVPCELRLGGRTRPT